MDTSYALLYTSGMSFEIFDSLSSTSNVIPVVRRMMADHLSPVLAYRRLVSSDDRSAPSFLFESVENGAEVGRFSFIGASPAIELIARRQQVVIRNHEIDSEEVFDCENPLEKIRELSSDWTVSAPIGCDDLPLPGFLGGWVGYAGYDSVRYAEPDAMPFSDAPNDDRNLPDVHFALYKTVVVFDHVAKIVHAVHNAMPNGQPQDAWANANLELDALVTKLQAEAQNIPVGTISIDLSVPPPKPTQSNMTQCEFEQAVETCKSYITAGDAFQIVISQRFEHQSTVDPFEIYRSLRVVNPSPYMIYLQTEDCILAASSPEILCRVQNGVVTNRPLAGTRKRGTTVEEDVALEHELKADEKECAEHVMLVDLGRNDLGAVCELGSIKIERVMDVERYSHVMHLSSTVSGTLADDKDHWDALSATLPVGTVSGAPKIRAMQIIDEIEPTMRGPYAGGIGLIGFSGDMDIAIALRTMVIPTKLKTNGLWRVDIQAGAGIVLDSNPTSEWQETVNKAAALGRAIQLAESAFCAD